MNRYRREGVRAGHAPVQARSASERWDRRWRRALRWGYFLAIGIHIALFLAFRTPWEPPERPYSPGMRAIEPIMAGGGGSMAQIEVTVTDPEEEPVEEAVVAEVVREPRPADVETPPTPEVEVALPGDGIGADDRIGDFEGRGEADAAGDGSGRGGEEGRISPPTPRGLILPPSGAPADMRGREIKVWVFVNVRGRVVSDSTRLEPPTSDARYNRRLISSAADWTFDPARQNGTAVAAWYPFEVIF